MNKKLIPIDEYEEIVKITRTIFQKIIVIMKDHIGKENSISRDHLFFLIMGYKPEFIGKYKVSYMKNLIGQVLGALRRDGILYTVYSRGGYFVLKDEEDLKIVNEKIEGKKQSLDVSLKRAKDWVKEKKWKSL